MSYLTSRNQPNALHLPVKLPDTPSTEDSPNTSAEGEEKILVHLDWSYLHTLSDSDHDFEMTLLDLFLQDCREQLNLLQEAIAQSDIKQIEKIAHYLKGASANVGALCMAHYAHQIEEQVRHTQLAACFDTEMNRLETSFGIIQDLFAAQPEAR